MLSFSALGEVSRAATVLAVRPRYAMSTSSSSSAVLSAFWSPWKSFIVTPEFFTSAVP